MPLKGKTILRLLAIFLFLMELLAPTILVAGSDSLEQRKSENSQINEAAPNVDFISHLLCEEINNEEREGKEEFLIPDLFLEVFNILQKFEPVHITWSLHIERFDTRPALFTLHRVLLI